MKLLEGIGQIFVWLFKDSLINNETQEAIIQEFWRMKMLCPKVIVVYAISTLDNYSNKTKVEEA